MKRKLSIILFSLFCILYSPQAVLSWDGDEGDVATIGSLGGLFENILGVALSLIGLTTFIMILVGGLKYLTSGGDPKQMEAAQSTLTYGIIGLVLAIGSWFILLAIQGFTGVEVTQFNVGLNP